VSDSSELDNESFARRMAQRRARSKFPDLPKDILPCSPCEGSGTAGGATCQKCQGFGFHRPDGSIAEVHSAKGGFYRWGATDALVETMMNAKLAYAGPGAPSGSSYSYDREGAFTFTMGDELAGLVFEARSTRFAKREVDGGLELWMLPTPAPDRARLRVTVESGEDNINAGYFVVWHHVGTTIAPVFLYRAAKHHTDMQSQGIRDRVAILIDAQYVSHPGHDEVPTAVPFVKSATVRRLPVMADQPAQAATHNVRTPEGVKALAADLPRAVGPIAVAFELRAELGKNIWRYSPVVEVLTV
jgi:hypothetical protein